MIFFLITISWGAFISFFFITCRLVFVLTVILLSLAGTGKSLLLRAIIMALKKKHAHSPDVVSVTASTGMAASNIGGIYRFTSQNRLTAFSDISP